LHRSVDIILALEQRPKAERRPRSRLEMIGDHGLPPGGLRTVQIVAPFENSPEH
jgi:hypothetical protein